MKTVAQSVEQILKTQPFLEDALQRNIINFSALAEELQDEISVILKKPVKTGAIMMALRRYKVPVGASNNIKVKKSCLSSTFVNLLKTFKGITFLEDKALISEKVIAGVETKPLSGYYGVAITNFLIFCYFCRLLCG